METKAYGSITITDVADAYSVGLTNESHVFAGSTDHAYAAETSTQIVAYKGSEAKSVIIQSVNGITPTTDYSGTNITGLSFKCSVLNGAEPTITFQATTDFAEQNTCSIPIVFKVDDITFTKTFSCSIAFQGDPGDPVRVEYQINQYHLSSNSDGTPSESSTGWKDNITDLEWENAVTIPSGSTQPTHVLWQRTKTVWSNGDTTYLYVHKMDSLDIATAVASANGKSVGELCRDEGITVIDGATIMTGTIEANRIKTDELQVKAANITGELTIGQLPSTVAEIDDIPTESDITTITNNTIKTTNVTATNLKVNAANITGTLTIGQLPSTVAETSDIPTSSQITTITNDTLKTTNVTAANLHVAAANITGKLTANQINADGITAENVDISGKITSTEGQIGGWNLTTMRLYKNYAGIASGDTKITSAVNSSTTSPIRFYAGASGDSYTKIDSSKFIVLEDGSLFASAADITGKITANEGKIGECTIKTDGSIESANGNFQVDEVGNLSAKNASISGLVASDQCLLVQQSSFKEVPITMFVNFTDETQPKWTYTSANYNSTACWKLTMPNDGVDIKLPLYIRFPETMKDNKITCTMSSVYTRYSDGTTYPNYVYNNSITVTITGQNTIHFDKTTLYTVWYSNLLPRDLTFRISSTSCENFVLYKGAMIDLSDDSSLNFRDFSIDNCGGITAKRGNISGFDLHDDCLTNYNLDSYSGIRGNFIDDTYSFIWSGGTNFIGTDAAFRIKQNGDLLIKDYNSNEIKIGPTYDGIRLGSNSYIKPGKLYITNNSQSFTAEPNGTYGCYSKYDSYRVGLLANGTVGSKVYASYLDSNNVNYEVSLQLNSSYEAHLRATNSALNLSATKGVYIGGFKVPEIATGSGKLTNNKDGDTLTPVTITFGVTFSGNPKVFITSSEVLGTDQPESLHFSVTDITTSSCKVHCRHSMENDAPFNWMAIYI